jgi:hypothetical protein
VRYMVWKKGISLVQMLMYGGIGRFDISKRLTVWLVKWIVFIKGNLAGTGVVLRWYQVLRYIEKTGWLVR